MGALDRLVIDSMSTKTQDASTAQVLRTFLGIKF
jgi:hypothetical protein